MNLPILIVSINLIGNEDYLNKGCGKSIVSTFTEKSGQMNQQKT
ncbi:hypothetical protein AAK943_14190 [Emergencia timonensis]|nr:hypothetical protein [Emergencia timonensis]